VTKTETVRVTPPPSYVQVYEVPSFVGDKNRDLLFWALDMQELLRKHNQDKQALRKWRQSVKEEN